MKKDLWTCVAIDCGNSSVRIVLGEFDGVSIKTTLVDQVQHREIQVNGVWHWDILFIFERIKMGLKKAHAAAGHIDSAGISTWGIDHGLLSRGGMLLGNPLCYRNIFGQEGLSRLSPDEMRLMFDRTGILCDKINSVFQILGYRERFPDYWNAAESILLIPDLLNYFLTGERNTDACITSTTQLYDVQTNRYAQSVFDRFGIDSALFPPIVPHGKQRGTLRRDLAGELDIPPFPVVSVPAHDTAAAVAAVPTDAPDGHPLFISSGTWSLIGVEMEKPLVTDAVYNAGLTNEAGILGTTTLLKNSIGLFIAQRLKKEMELAGNLAGWDEIVQGLDCSRECPLIDPNDPEFFNPPSMKAAIAAHVRERGFAEPASDGDYFRIVYESLARSYRDVIHSLEEAAGTCFPTVNIIGGGSRNRFLNQATAAATGKKVVAGPSEATSLGTVASQLLFEGSVNTLEDIRRIVAASCETAEFGA